MIYISCSQGYSTSKSQISITFPVYQTGQLPQIGSDSQDGSWGLADPLVKSEINCWAILISGPEPEMSSSQCMIGRTDTSPQIPLRMIPVGVIHGGYKAGESITLDVLSGERRNFYLFGFKASPLNFCMDFNQSMQEGFLSNPYLVAIQEGVDLRPGVSTQVDFIPELISTQRVDDCNGPAFLHQKFEPYHPQGLPYLGDGSDGILEVPLGSTMDLETTIGDKGVPLVTIDKITSTIKISSEEAIVVPESSWDGKIASNDLVNLYVNSAKNGKTKMLYRIDGVTKQMIPLKTVDVDSLNSPTYLSVQGLSNFFLFVAKDSVHGNELWISDGSVSGTQLLKDINPGPSDSNPTNFFLADNGKIYFWADDGIHGSELWQTDGSALGTTLVKDINTNLGVGSVTSGRSDMISKDQYTFFYANGNDGVEVYYLNTGTNDVSLTGNLSTATGYNVNVPGEYNQISTDGVYVYFANYQSTGMILYKFDLGTKTATALSVSNPHSLIFNGTNRMYYMEYVPGQGNVIKYYSGGGQYLFKDPDTSDSGISSSSNGFYNRVMLGSKLLFIWGHQSLYGYEFWSTDDLQGSASLLKDIYPNSLSGVAGTEYGTGSYNSFDYNQIILNGKLLFVGVTPTEGQELWSTDGTTGGTLMVSDIASGTMDSSPRAFALNGSYAYFWARNSLANQIFRTNGGTIEQISDFIDDSDSGSLAMRPFALGSDMYVFIEVDDPNPPCGDMEVGQRLLARVQSYDPTTNEMLLELDQDKLNGVNQASLNSLPNGSSLTNQFCEMTITRVPQLDSIEFHGGSLVTNFLHEPFASQYSAPLIIKTSHGINVYERANHINLDGAGYAGAGSENSYASGYGTSGHATSGGALGNAGGTDYSCGFGGGHATSGAGSKAGEQVGDAHACGLYDINQSCLTGKIFMGGGGGHSATPSTHRGHGGGSLILESRTIHIFPGASLTLSAKGKDGVAIDNGYLKDGGGGAGGSVLLQVENLANEGSINIDVSGGNSSMDGSCTQQTGASAGRSHVNVFNQFIGNRLKVQRTPGNGVPNKGTCFFSHLNVIDCL